MSAITVLRSIEVQKLFLEGFGCQQSSSLHSKSVGHQPKRQVSEAGCSLREVKSPPQPKCSASEAEVKFRRRMAQVSLLSRADASGPGSLWPVCPWQVSKAVFLISEPAGSQALKSLFRVLPKPAGVSGCPELEFQPEVGAGF